MLVAVFLLSLTGVWTPVKENRSADRALGNSKTKESMLGWRGSPTAPKPMVRAQKGPEELPTRTEWFDSRETGGLFL